jgi:hypothetical protein
MLAAGAVLASLLASPAPLAAADTPSGQFAIEVVTVNGSGCPAGTAMVAAANNTEFTVAYSDYLAQTGGGAAPTDFRQNCQLSVRVVPPNGYTFAIARVDYQGYAHLAAGASGAEIANYYFQGSSENASIGHSFTGPYDDTWQTADITAASSLVYAPCGVQRNLNINTELRVSAGSSDAAKTPSFMAMDSTRASVHSVYRLAWARCQ